MRLTGSTSCKQIWLTVYLYQQDGWLKISFIWMVSVSVSGLRRVCTSLVSHCPVSANVLLSSIPYLCTCSLVPPQLLYRWFCYCAFRAVSAGKIRSRRWGYFVEPRPLGWFFKYFEVNSLFGRPSNTTVFEVLLVMSHLCFKAKMDPFTCLLHHQHTSESLDSQLLWHQLSSDILIMRHRSDP